MEDGRIDGVAIPFCGETVNIDPVGERLTPLASNT
jgi:hypothetical protein